jgi:hypothetical protein
MNTHLLTKATVWTADATDFDENDGAVWSFVWHGYHTINVLLDGVEIDCFSCYDDNGNYPTAAVVEALIQDYLNFSVRC